MRLMGGHDAGATWRAAIVTALITSTLSTLVIVLGTGRSGQDVALKFMEISAVLLRGLAAAP